MDPTHRVHNERLFDPRQVHHVVLACVVLIVDGLYRGWLGHHGYLLDDAYLMDTDGTENIAGPDRSYAGV